jgi:hypothetical protein
MPPRGRAANAPTGPASRVAAQQARAPVIVTQDPTSRSAVEPQPSAFSLTLRDGSCWIFGAADSRGTDVLARLATICELNPSGRHQGGLLRIDSTDGLPQTNIHQALTVSSLPVLGVVGSPAGLFCALPAKVRFDARENSLPLQILCIPTYFSLMRGGVVMHAALVTFDGQGYLLAGKSGAGKSTAASRVPPPWEALCDEMVLAVPDPAGDWWAHPWPTWSKIALGGEGSWPVERAVPLGAMAFA